MAASDWLSHQDEHQESRNHQDQGCWFGNGDCTIATWRKIRRQNIEIGNVGVVITIKIAFIPERPVLWISISHGIEVTGLRIEVSDVHVAVKFGVTTQIG